MIAKWTISPMTRDSLQPILTPAEHRIAVAELLGRCRGDADALRLIAEVERIVRFELERPLPAAEQLLGRLTARNECPAQRIAMISDIHGNHAGLMAALDDIAAQGCDRIVCLGDLVEGGPGNEQVIETLRERGVPCVRGNHDENNDAALSSAARQFLNALPEAIVEDDVLFIHISPRAKKRKIDHAVEAWNVFEESNYRLTFVGHAHVPYIFGQRSRSYGEACRHAFEYNQPFAMDRSDRYIVSVGSIGYGRDTVAKIRYCIFDQKAGTIENRAIDGPLLPLDYSVASFSSAKVEECRAGVEG